MLTDGRTTDGRTDDRDTAILIAHLGTFGSGELKKQVSMIRKYHNHTSADHLTAYEKHVNPGAGQFAPPWA